MPLEVCIDVIPHGIEARRERIGTVWITQVEKLDSDPDGMRLYEVVGTRESLVEHRRSDGAAVLVAKALAVDSGVSGG